jgi:hypothetical protein
MTSPAARVSSFRRLFAEFKYEKRNAPNRPRMNADKRRFTSFSSAFICVHSRLQFVLLALLLFVCTPLDASPLTPLLDKISAKVNGDRAMETVRRVYSTDRWFTFPQFHRTAAYLDSAMRKAGLAQVEVLGAPADGKTQAGFWTMPLAWDVKQARLEIVEPAVPASRRVLADYQKIPTSVGMWSGPTPRGGLVAEVALADAADWKGKLVLTDKNSANLKWRLVKAGAAGAINGWSENPALEDERQWVNAWGDKGWAFNADDTPLVSFSITPRDAKYIRELIAQRGRVKVRAVVNSKLYSDTYPYITGVIPGETNEEVLTLGHTSEQGAHDNATGVATMLEAMTVLNSLIASGELPKPNRTIRMLAMGELYGSMHYVAQNPERIKRTIAAFCVDTPAASYEAKGTEYTFYLNPHAQTSYVDAFTLELAKEYFARVNRPWHSKPFMPGTDTFLADPMIGIPTVWPYSGTGVHTHHNSADRPETVDVRSLRDLVVVNASWLYFLASAGKEEAEWLKNITAEHARRILAAITDTEKRLYEWRWRSAITSLRRLHSDVDVSNVWLDLDEYGHFVAPQKAGRGIIVKRKRFGTIPLDDLHEDKREGYPSGAWATVPTIALFWCDGKRDLSEVIRLTELELGPQKFDFVGYFRFLAKHGYVEMVDIGVSK